MNYSKVIKRTAEIMGFIGFFLLLGTAGTSDYMNELGVCHSFTELIPRIVIGLAMVIVSSFVVNVCEYED